MILSPSAEVVPETSIVFPEKLKIYYADRS